MNEIAAAYLGTGARVWIIDVGRSYEKACRNFGGSFIEFTEDAALSLNPFPLVEDIDEDMELLQPLLAQMVSPRESLDGFQYSTLGAAIKKVWKAKGRAMTVTDIHDLLATGRLDDDGAPSAGEGDRRLKDLAAMLHPYTRDGAYGKYFDSEASIDFGADLIVLELEELKSKKDLQTVVLLIVMYRITREMYFSRDRKKIVIIDEAWDLLSGGATAEFIEAGYRRARKYKGAFMSATQGVDDYYRNPAAKAALDNSDWMFLLRQKPESIEMMDKLGQLTMDDAMKRLLLSLRTEHGAYSEVFIHSPAGNGIGRLIVDPYSLLLFSSRAEDFNAINAKRAAGMDVSAAIDAVLRERGSRERQGRRPAGGRQRAGERRADRARSPVARARAPAGAGRAGRGGALSPEGTAGRRGAGQARRQRRGARRRTASRRGLRHGGEHAAPGAAGRVPLHRAGAWCRDGLRTPAARPDAGRAAPARPVAAPGDRMRTLFLHRSWRDRLASSGRCRLRTFAERSVDHLKRWAFVYVAARRDRALVSRPLWLRAERLAQPAAPALPHPQGRDAQPRRLRGLPLGRRRTVPGGRHLHQGARRHARRRGHARRAGLPPQRRSGGRAQAGEPARPGARTRSHRPDSGGPLLRAGRAPGQPRLPVPADRLDPRVPDHRAGRCALLNGRSQAARPAAGRCGSQRPSSPRCSRRCPPAPRTSASSARSTRSPSRTCWR
ncbi:MAG: hypothetical protein MZU91_12860 [Desulfosudis oleivorans]|nr:hypothetical protein [Desulfosudis oleivorans]